jgi:hypothetical protein
LWAWVGFYAAFAVFVVLLPLAFGVLSRLLAVDVAEREVVARG